MSGQSNGDNLWHYSASGESYGPVGTIELRRILKDRSFPADTPVWKEGMAGWAAAGEVVQFRDLFVATEGNPDPAPKPLPPVASEPPSPLPPRAVAPVPPPPAAVNPAQYIAPQNGVPFFSPPASYFLVGSLAMLLIVCVILVIAVGLSNQQIRRTKVSELAQQIVGNPALQQQLRADEMLLRRQRQSIRANYQSRAEVLQKQITASNERLTLVNAKIARLQRVYAADRAQLKSAQQNDDIKISQLVSRLKATNVAIGKLVGSLARSVVIERKAASKLAVIFQESAAIHASAAPLVKKLLASNREFRHTGAEGLALALQANTMLITHLSNELRTFDVSHKRGLKEILTASRVANASNAILHEKIAQATGIFAKVLGTIAINTTGGGQIRPASVVVTLEQATVPRSQVSASLKSLLRYLRNRKAAFAAIATNGGTVNSVRSGQMIFQAYPPGTTPPVPMVFGPPPLAESMQWVRDQADALRQRIRGVKAYLQNLPDRMDTRDFFLFLWDHSNPAFYPRARSTRNPLHFAHPRFAVYKDMVLPPGFSAAVKPGIVKSTLTGSKGEFAFRHVSEGKYYLSAVVTNASGAPSSWLIMWLRPVVIRSRLTVKMNLTQSNAIEVAITK